MTKKEIKNLLNLRAFPHSLKYLDLKETYISWLFFTGKYVYKIKKPVKYSYLDFSTLKKRKYFLEKELKLNQRIAKDIYLDVVPIVKKGNQIKILKSSKESILADEGVLDYALKMREIPESYYLPELIKKGKLKKSSIDRIAKVLADFHQKAEAKNYSALKFLNKNWKENFENLKSSVGQTIRKPIFEFLKIKVEKFLKENKDLFEKRQREGRIRDCHGDFHTGNIFITPSRIYVIDCIEFNKRFRIGDVASDVGFLAMDLELLGQKELADYFVERYILYSGDREVLKLLDFYKCYYAYVKGKVAAFSNKNKEAEKYFSLAFKYTINFSKLPPFLIVIFGKIGTGKTTLAGNLSEITRFFLLRSDIVRKELFKIPLFSHKKLKFKAGIYTPQITKQVYQELIKRANYLIKKGESVILDATFAKKEFRDKVIILAEKLKVPYYFFECSLPERKIVERLEKRKKKKEISDADVSIYFQHKKEFEPVKIPKGHYLRINTNSSLASEVEKVLNKILCLK